MNTYTLIEIGTNHIYIRKDYDKEFIFNWRQATNNDVYMEKNCFLYNWLCTIKFTTIYAIILEIVQSNIYCVLANREKTFKQIACDMNINFDFFYECINKIQQLLIENNKVKVCKDGKVIIMNGV